MSHDRLVLNLFDFHSAAALAQNGGDNTITKTIKSFVDRVVRSLPGSKCGFSTASPKDFRVTLAVQDRHDFSTANGPNPNWRSGLTEVFMQNAQASHDCMIKKVEDICSDLEQRCYNVEGPLRAVEEERDSAIHEAEKLKQHNEGLEVRLQESSNTVSVLRHELSCLEEHTESASARAEELSASLDSARHDLQEQHQAFEERMRAEMVKRAAESWI
jgi:FtsZ-binding cell division protein ZapB